MQGGGFGRHCFINECVCRTEKYCLATNFVATIKTRAAFTPKYGCLDQYAAQNSKYARPPMPSQPITQKVFFQWHTQYDPTMKH